LDGLAPTLRDVIHYRKSGLSLNHIIGCPLDCAYCIRHSENNFEMKTPKLIMSDDDALEALLSNQYFRRHSTPIQLFNKATDPLLPSVKPHTHSIVRRLDQRGLRNHLLIISRLRLTDDDCEQFNTVRNLRLTLLFTYSGIDDHRIEPVHSAIAADSIRLGYRQAKHFRVLLYWRPIILGLNDSEHDLQTAFELSQSAHATVFTGLFYRDAIANYYRHAGLPIPYSDTARRKILPRSLDQRITGYFAQRGSRSLFRKTSCGVAYAHRTADYNGHYGIPDLCDICPAAQRQRCATAFRRPTIEDVDRTIKLASSEAIAKFAVDDRAIHVSGLSDAERYFTQHALGYQVHNDQQPHHTGRHGRAEIGWEHEDDAAD
jgi:DNA repair photolyase